MTEKALQNYTKRQAETMGIYWRKVEFTRRRGCPDVLMCKNGRVVWVEFKNPDGSGRLSALQEREIRLLRQAGMEVHVIDNYEAADTLLWGLNHGV